jgi:hypothetical protein
MGILRRLRQSEEGNPRTEKKLAASPHLQGMYKEAHFFRQRSFSSNTDWGPIAIERS